MGGASGRSSFEWFMWEGLVGGALWEKLFEVYVGGALWEKLFERFMWEGLCGRGLWEKLFERFMWEGLVGGACGKSYLRGLCGRGLWEKLIFEVRVGGTHMGGASVCGRGSREGVVGEFTTVASLPM